MSKRVKRVAVTKETEADKIRKMDDAAINKAIAELKTELFNLRFQAAVGSLENTAQIKKNRKQIARMKTILNERIKAEQEAHRG